MAIIQPFPNPNQNVWIQQPAPAVTVAIQQPVLQTQFVQPRRDWSTGLCACCHDYKTCFCAMFCYTCLVGQMTSRMGECCCVPCLPGGMAALRTKMRERYRIQGGICTDHCDMMCCGVLAVCQMDRELNIMEQQGKFCN